MKRGVLAVLSLCAITTGARGLPAPCATAGCFVFEASGDVSRNGAGTATYGTLPGGQLVILLTIPESSRVTIVMTRDSGGVPAAETELTLDTKRCDDGMEDGGYEDVPGTMHVSVRGGSPLMPDWLLVGSTGSVTVSQKSGVAIGMFRMKACGEDVKGDRPLAVDIVGSFRARGRP
jgi:hypothetical protein